MRPDQSAVVLKNFDGYSTYPWISPLLLVALAAFSLASLLKAKARGIVFAIGSLFSIVLLSLTTISVATQDLRNVQSLLEETTGIAASHGLDSFEISVGPAAQLSLFCFALMASSFFLAAIAQAKWVKSQSPQSTKRASGRAIDSISLWDQQR
jgi:ABC-type branched-subunit amino acid transport system permease subunit